MRKRHRTREGIAGKMSSAACREKEQNSVPSWPDAKTNLDAATSSALHIIIIIIITFAVSRGLWSHSNKMAAPYDGTLHVWTRL